MGDNSGGGEEGRTSVGAVIAQPFGTLGDKRKSGMVGLVLRGGGAMQVGQFSEEGKKLNEGGVGSNTKKIAWLTCM